MKLIKRGHLLIRTHHFKYKKPRFDQSIQIGKNNFWKCFNFLALENVKHENETDAASAACFQNIKYQVEDNIWPL